MAATVMTSDLVSVQPSGVVLVFEDNDDDVEIISRGLMDAGIDNYLVARNLTEFSDLVQKHQVDVNSIDWDIDSKFVGGRALREARDSQEYSANIVYTANYRKSEVVERAGRFGADAVIEKLADIGSTEYVDSVKKGIRVAMARRIAALLQERGEAVPPIEPRLSLTEETESQLCTLGREAGIRMRLNRERDESLIYELSRRGWWRSFEPSRYADLLWSEKILYFAEIGGLSLEGLAQISASEGNVIGRILAEKKSPVLGEEPEEVAQVLDNFISVMFFMLRVSGFEPEVLAKMVGSPKFLVGGNLVSPWEGDTPLHFLLGRGPAGVRECIRWIRSL